MTIQLRERRIDNEWRLLQQVIATGEGQVEILGRHFAPEETLFHVVLHQTCGILPTASGKTFVFSHIADIRFTRFFPSVPIEVNLRAPVFHPNVDPGNGFVCLWNKFSPADTVLEALLRLQHVISWSWVNLDSAHVMQPAAIQWHKDPLRQTELPLEFSPIIWPKGRLAGGQFDKKPRDQIRRRLERLP
ncbi:MAG: hypothetical protein WAO35_28555 [Terriglobia bacterium]